MPKLQSPTHLKAEIYRLELKISTLIPFQPSERLYHKLKQLKEQLHDSTVQQLKLLAQKLRYKADIYADGRRIYSFEHAWTVTPDGKLFHGSTEYQPSELTDGHGRPIHSFL